MRSQEWYEKSGRKSADRRVSSFVIQRFLILNKQYLEFGIDSETLRISEEVLKSLRTRFEEIDQNAEYNSLKVIRAMQECRLSEDCMNGTTGYGYGDAGRESIEAIYAKTFSAESALVRPQIACGTHALSVALSGNLRPGDGLLSISGKPYDTLEEVIGIRPSKGSLAEYGVTYDQVDLLPNGSFDLEGIRRALKPATRLVAIQRSKGYAARKSLSCAQIKEAVRCVKETRPDIICMVDNCYGEFVERIEPTDVGADLIVGTLKKNPGGGLAPTGGYIAGRREYVDAASYRLTSPGLGKEVGATLSFNRPALQGFFLAPTVTASALKGAVFAAALYERFGFEVIPSSSEERTDIIQSVVFRSADRVIAFCQGIQRASAVDSHVVPEPWDMPGYDHPVIMAAGDFVSGSSIELSADAPIREPYSVYFQGGLTWPSAKLGILMSLQTMKDRGLLPDVR